MSDPLLSKFPGLRRGYVITSLDTPRYNCVAWAAGDNRRWWWPSPGAFWPSGAPTALTVESFVNVYESIGYAVCDDGTLEGGVEKIVIYADANGVPKHAARQLPSGWWTSKLDKSFDIEHTDPDGVSGADYGRPTAYLRRQRAGPATPQVAMA